MSGTATAAPAPLSVAQEALVYTGVLTPARLDYNESIAIHKDGPLDLAALRRAVTEVMRRHEAWRTTFTWGDGEPVALVHPVPVLPLPALDLSHLPFDDAQRQAARVAGRLAAIPYDLRHGPLVRPRLITFPGRHHRLVLAMHHLAFDGVCASRVILPELVTLYEAFRSGSSSPLPEPASSYADFARWERAWGSGPREARRLEHWRRRLDGAPSLELPLDHPRPPARTGRGEIVAVSLSAHTVGRLREIAVAAGASLFQALATGWAMVLSTFSGQDDVVFATAADLRQRREFEQVVGYCLSPLVLRVDLGGDPGGRELLARVRNELLDGLGNLVPFERIVRALARGRAASGNPIYRTMITLEPEYFTPDPSWSLHQLASDVDATVGASKLDLELQLDVRPDGHLQGRLIHDPDLFTRSTAAALAGHWVRVCQTFAADPSLPASRIQAESVAAARAGGAGPPKPLPPPWPSLAAALAHAATAETTSGQVAASHARPGGVSARRVTALADVLTGAGLGRGDVVALACDTEADELAGILAVAAVGAASVRLEADAGPVEWAQVLERTGARTALAAERLADRLPGGIRVLAYGESTGTSTRLPSPPPPGAGGAIACVHLAVREASARVGIPVPERAILLGAHALAAELALGPADTWLSLRRTPFEPWVAVMAGARVVTAGGAAGDDGAELSRLLAEEDVTFVHADPERWHRLLETGLRARRGLRALVSGAPPSEALVAALLERCQVVWTVFGYPETGGVATVARVVPGASVTIGRPLDVGHVHIVDDRLQPLPDGAPGHLLVSGPLLSPGYLAAAPALEAERFVVLPDGQRAFRTGERARRQADGDLVLVPRA